MKVVLCGYYGMGNGGDEALLAVLLDMLPAHVTPIVLSGNPTHTAQTYGVAAYPRKSFTQVLTVLKQADGFIWGGGSLMQDATSLMNPIYYGGLMVLAQRLGLKTIAWAQGIGPLQRSPSRWLTRYCFQHCTAVSVRDQRSADLLHQWGISALCAPDPVWALSSEPFPDLAIDWTQDAIAVVLRPHPLLTPARLDRLTQGLNQFQQATQTQVLLVPFQPVNDRAIATTIQAQLSGPSQIIELTHPRQLHALFSKIKFTIAMRLHGVIMAAAAGNSCWAISYDPKVTQLMQSLNIPGWELDQLPDDVNRISQPWIEQYEQYRQGSGNLEKDMTQPSDAHHQGHVSLAELRQQALLHRSVLEDVLCSPNGGSPVGESGGTILKRGFENRRG
ncbi:MAG: polysaccharide pyruvyl transferase CsaB [Merismopedia sp. SIO2A8]|nr:polysaccharide pyruvyl transferase CsaB [Merismopedia sp. SIO2A8]